MSILSDFNYLWSFHFICQSSKSSVSFVDLFKETTFGFTDCHYCDYILDYTYLYSNIYYLLPSVSFAIFKICFF